MKVENSKSAKLALILSLRCIDSIDRRVCLGCHCIDRYQYLSVLWWRCFAGRAPGLITCQGMSDIGCQWWQLQLYSELDSAIHGFSATHSSQLYMGLSWTGIWIQLYKEYVLFLSFLKSIYTVYTAL